MNEASGHLFFGIFNYDGRNDKIFKQVRDRIMISIQSKVFLY